MGPDFRWGTDLSSENASPRLRVRRRYIPAVGPRLRRLLYGVLGLFALLTFNSVYLGTITFAEWVSGDTYQDYFYQYMFLAHLGLGLIIILPVLVYGGVHIRNAYDRPNRRAVRVGYGLFATAIVLLASGLLLTRGIPLVEVRQPQIRDAVYWLHIITPLVVAWLFILHRLSGPRINWRFGGAVASLPSPCSPYRRRTPGSGTLPGRPAARITSSPRWHGRPPAISFPPEP